MVLFPPSPEPPSDTEGKSRHVSRRNGGIPFVCLDHADPELLAELLEAVARLARQSAFTLGEEVESFEREFAEYCGTRTAVGVSSGTDALCLIFRALRLGPGDEVVVPANSFIATAEAVSLVGAHPRFADVDPATGLLTPDHVEAVLTERTRCVVPVHLYGRTVDMDPICAHAAAHDLIVVEDAAQAHGARYRDRRVGSLGRAAAFSMYPTKNLGAWGDAGAVTTNDLELADRIRLLRSHGERPRYHHQLIGATARLDGIQAAILRVKLRHLDDGNEARRRIAGWYERVLAGGVRSPFRRLSGGEDCVYHLYEVSSSERDGLRAHLREHGIETGVHYPVPIHLSPAYRRNGATPTIPAAEGLADTLLSLPIFPSMSEDMVDEVATVVQSYGGTR